MHFIVKLFQEITIKSTPVRRRFSRQLQSNLRTTLQSIVPDVEVKLGWDKLDVQAPTDDETAVRQVATVLARTPGIANFAPVEVIEFADLDELGAALVPIWRSRLAGKTFCVRAKRSGDHDFNSMEAERVVGGILNQRTDAAGVKLHAPDQLVAIEIKQNLCYVLLDQRPGLGGFPLGTQDPVLSLVSGGFDSTVASYLCVKRGLITHFCFFNLGGRAHELGVKEVSYFLWEKFAASHKVRFVTVPFENVVTEILETIHHSQMGVVLKRMMLRVATKVAAELKIQALVTGESVAQVSSQTLPNLSVIDSVTDTLVLRPLITTDKGDIINTARRIGTEDFAANMPEYCGVISVKPTTRATEPRVAREESKFNFDKLDQAFEQRRVVSIVDVGKAGVGRVSAEKDAGGLNAPVFKEVPNRAVVIDIRHPDEEEKRPLSLPASTLKKIPFYQLSRLFPQLESDTQYLLYCDKGVMSQLHAAYLLESGFAGVGVYEPDKAQRHLR